MQVSSPGHELCLKSFTFIPLEPSTQQKYNKCSTIYTGLSIFVFPLKSIFLNLFFIVTSLLGIFNSLPMYSNPFLHGMYLININAAQPLKASIMESSAFSTSSAPIPFIRGCVLPLIVLFNIESSLWIFVLCCLPKFYGTF